MEGTDKINKQADTLMLYQTLGELMMSPASSLNEYAPLCMQTSSLSLTTHAILAARLGMSRDARKMFNACIGVDIDDNMGNAFHGIHGAGQAGVWLTAWGIWWPASYSWRFKN